MSEPSLYETVLGAAPGPAARPPRASAAVVPWRRRQDGGLEVFWIRRADALSFMGGWHAFPGGGLAKGDEAIQVEGEPRGLGATASALPASLLEGLAELPPDLVPGLAAAALRELFEETGLLLARPALEPAEAAADRRRLLAGEAAFAALLAERGLALDASRLVFAGRWLTPPFGPLRFDNRFFLLEWPADEPLQPEVWPGEAAEGEWIAPGEAWSRWRRGDVLAAPPILHLLRVLAEDGPEAGLPRLRQPAEADLGPVRRIEFRPGVILLPMRTRTLPPATHTNAYLLGFGEAALVDPGSDLPAEVERLLAALAAAREQGRRTTAIWLTHHHADHVGGVEAVRRALGVPVLAHRLTAERLATRGIAVDGELADGQRLVLGGDPAMPVRVVHTPGHARGHLCFLDEDGGSLVAGDMVAGLGTIVVDPPEGDMDDYLASLGKLADLVPKTLFPAHGPTIKDAVGTLRHYAEHRLWREAKVLAAWSAGMRTPSEMVATVYDDAPKEAHPLAERQIMAHLERLRRAGRI